jgi:hypothetical protein
VTSTPFGPQSWQILYSKACNETDHDALTKLVIDVEEAMFLRQQELMDSHADRNERRAMRLASDALLIIKTTKLKWPGLTAVKPPRLNRSYRDS